MVNVCPALTTVAVPCGTGSPSSVIGITAPAVRRNLDRITQPSYTLLNLMARYEFNKQLSAQLNGPKRALTAVLNARLIGMIDRLVAAGARDIFLDIDFSTSSRPDSDARDPARCRTDHPHRHAGLIHIHKFVVEQLRIFVLNLAVKYARPGLIAHE